MLLLLDNDVVASLLDDMGECVRVLDEADREWALGEANSIPRIEFLAPMSNKSRFFQFGVMSGGSRRWKMFCIRMLDDVVYTESKEGTLTREKYCIEPGTYCGFVLLFSTENAEPLALIKDGVLQHVRVGGQAGVANNYLARKDAETIGMLGSGGMARTFAEATCAVRKIRSVKVFSPTKGHREAYAVEMSRKLGVDVKAVDEPREAVRGADIVCCCTDSLKPVMFGRWLEPGMHVCAVQGEVDEELVRRADLVVRLSNDVLAPREGRTMNYMAWNAYFIGKEEDFALLPRKKPDIAKVGQAILLTHILIGKHPGRTSDEQITYTYAAGPNDTVGFVALAGLAYTKAVERGVGLKIPTEWFTQKIRD